MVETVSMRDMSQRIDDLRSRIANACIRAGRDVSQIRIVAVTKTHSAAVAQAVIDAGIQDVGENRVQELLQKAPLLRGNFSLHLIGHLQTNKISKILSIVRWIHSIDRIRLIEAIELRGGRLSGRINALVQVNTTGEPTKSGCSPDDCRALCERVAASSALCLRGLMTMGPLHGGELEQRACFSLLRRLGEKISDLVAGPVELSMGMSNDFEVAIEEGATIIRVGTLLFGPR